MKKKHILDIAYDLAERGEFLWTRGELLVYGDKLFLIRKSRKDKKLYIQEVKEGSKSIYAIWSYKDQGIEFLLHEICKQLRDYVKEMCHLHIIDVDVTYEIREDKDGILFKLVKTGISLNDLNRIGVEIADIINELDLLDKDLSKKLQDILFEIRDFTLKVYDREEELSKKAKKVDISKMVK